MESFEHSKEGLHWGWSIVLGIAAWRFMFIFAPVKEASYEYGLSCVFGTIFILHVLIQVIQDLIPIDEDLDISELRDDPEKLEELEERFEAVVLTSRPYSYEAFAIDTEGETHTIASGSNWEEVRAPAKWLARRLDISYRDDT